MHHHHLPKDQYELLAGRTVIYDAVDDNQPLFDAAWRRVTLMAVLLVGWLLYWYWDTARSLVEVWGRAGPYYYGFVLPWVSLWLLVEKRRYMKSFCPRPSLLALFGLAAAGGLWLFGASSAMNSPSHWGWIGMFVALAPVLVGWRIARILAFPLLYLLLAVPVGDEVLPPLMSLCASITVGLLNMLSVPLLRDGPLLVLPSGAWAVSDAFSGIRYLLALLAFSVFYAYRHFYTVGTRLGFVLTSLLVLLGCNTLGALLIVMAAHSTETALVNIVDHKVYNWGLLLLECLLLMGITALWKDKNRPPRPTPHREFDAKTGPGSFYLSFIFLLAGGISAAPMLWLEAQKAPATTPVRTTAPLRLPPVQLLQWQASEPNTTWQPHYPGASDQLFQMFRYGPYSAGLCIAYYRQQSGDNKLISNDNSLVRPYEKSWLIRPYGDQTILYTGQNQELDVNRVELFNPGTEQVLTVWQWYWLDGYLTNSELIAKLYTAWTRISGGKNQAASVMVFTTNIPGQSPDTVLSAFSTQAGPSIEQVLHQAEALP